MSVNVLLLAGAWMVHHGQGLFYFTHNLLGLLLLLTLACIWNASLLLSALFFKNPGWPGWAKGYGLILLLLLLGVGVTVARGHQMGLFG